MSRLYLLQMSQIYLQQQPKITVIKNSFFGPLENRRKQAYEVKMFLEKSLSNFFQKKAERIQTNN